MPERTPAGVAIPPDPQSLDATRPDDLDTCVTCAGYRSILTNPRDPASVEDCATCNGTGDHR